MLTIVREGVMKIIDIIIIILLIFGFVKGSRNGLIKQAISLGGLVVEIILAFLLKNYLSIIFYENLPFISLGGVFKGVESINIIIYEFLAFFIVLSLLMIVFRIVIFASGIINKIVNCTIILTLPNKLLGGIIGVIEIYIYVFLVLLITSSFNINNTFLRDNSSFDEPILKNTPILSSVGSNMIVVADELLSIKDKYDDSADSDVVNYEVVKILLDKKIVSVESIDKLIKSNKLNSNLIDNEFLNNYRK